MAYRKAKVIAIVNQKGGVAKSTTSQNLGVALASKRKKVLLIDLDPQGSLSKFVDRYYFRKNVGYDEDGKPKYENYTLPVKKTIFGVLQGQTNMKEIILDTGKCDIAPTNILMANADVALAGEMSREKLLKEAIKEVRNLYDYILIDCPPSLGLLTLNAMVAADSIIIPIAAEYAALEGTAQLLDTTKIVKKKFNTKLKVMGFVLTRVDKRRALDRSVEEEVRTLYKDVVFHTVIRQNAPIAEAPSKHTDIFSYAASKKNCYGIIDYRNLAKEVIERSE